MTSGVTIIGKGKMGQALASYFVKAGIPTQLIGREQLDIKGAVVILAIPFEAMTDTISAYQDKLVDKIVIDISNPVDYQTKTSKLDATESMSLILAKTFPNLRFLKAFNTNFTSSQMEASQSPTVLIAGDDSSDKALVTKLLSKANFSVVNTGNMEVSRDLEAFARMQMVLFARGVTSGMSQFAL